MRIRKQTIEKHHIWKLYSLLHFSNLDDLDSRKNKTKLTNYLDDIRSCLWIYTSRTNSSVNAMITFGLRTIATKYLPNIPTTRRMISRYLELDQWSRKWVWHKINNGPLEQSQMFFWKPLKIHMFGNETTSNYNWIHEQNLLTHELIQAKARADNRFFTNRPEIKRCQIVLIRQC